jgi:hypothetical protein
VWFMPHMHLRGKDMTCRLTYPDGRSEIVLSVPRYDFEWQLAYYVEKPISVPKGTRLHVTAHYDNSANNRFNPNPNRPVWWGDQAWEEMMVPSWRTPLGPGEIWNLDSDVFLRGNSLATTINAELAEPAANTGFVLRVLRFLR